MFWCFSCILKHTITFQHQTSCLKLRNVAKQLYFARHNSNEKSLISFTRRSHNCGELRYDHIGHEVTLCGWLQYQRLGGQFLTLRDAHGVTQINVPRGMMSTISEFASMITLESVLEVTGEVQSRPTGKENKNMTTGDIEIIAKDLKILNACKKEMPFQIHDFHKIKESLRMEYRYLDIRQTEMQRNLRLRSQMLMKMREYLCNLHGFVNVETPTLFRRTPGGAKEFIVPTHTPGKFYSLPQSPQQFKQLLMVGGIDRYMQIARCYRDEQAKPDRQPEFTQLDLEMSFVTQEDIKNLSEGLISHCWPDHLPPLSVPFPRMTYAQAIAEYGSDKPDTRFDMKLQDITNLLSDMQNPDLFYLVDAVTYYPATSVQAVNFTGAGGVLTNKNYKELDKIAKLFLRDKQEKVWYAVIKVKEEGNWQGTLASTLGHDLHHDVNLHLNLKEGDLLLVAAGHHTSACSLLGRLRVEIANMMEVNGKDVHGDKNQMNFLWVEDFPLFLPKEDGTEGLESTHHPFTAPHPDHHDLVYDQPEGAISQHYDLVLNGCEIGGGSIRIHDSSLQKYILAHVLKEDDKSLSHLLEALQYGCPPHGGIALGLDRFFAMMCGADSIRDVIAFPKSSKGEDLMAKAPSEISAEDAKYYCIQSLENEID